MSFFSFRTSVYWVFLGLFCVSAAAETVLHNVNGYTSSSDGIREFSVLVFDDSGKVVAIGDDSLLAGRPENTRLDGGGLTE
ncbi:MAG: hypothetical protein GY783_07660, partial [Gammaproteobacteria bacterium]|nr:hypothetical protein [Gammaproteobacteria bacterium]